MCADGSRRPLAASASSPGRRAETAGERGREGEREKVGNRTASPLQCLQTNETYAGDASFRRLDEDSRFGVLVLLCRSPFSLAVANSHKNKQTSCVRCSPRDLQPSTALIVHSWYRFSWSCVAISCSSATKRCWISSSSLVGRSKTRQTFLLLVGF